MKNAKPHDYARSFCSLYQKADDPSTGSGQERTKSALIKNTARTLAKQGKGKTFIDRTLHEIELLLEKSAGIERIKVDTQTALTATKKEALAHTLAKKLGFKKVIIDNFLDERNIAGMKLTIGDIVYDYTVKGRLEKLTSRLTR